MAGCSAESENLFTQEIGWSGRSWEIEDWKWRKTTRSPAVIVIALRCGLVTNVWVGGEV
jgi:hypothetical protein